MPDTQTHYFRDADDTRVVVVTTPTRSGGYKATIKDDNVIAYGFGATRLGAIADLNDNIALER